MWNFSRFRKIGVPALVVFCASPCFALSTSYDVYNDAAGGNRWEVYSVNYGHDSTNLYVEYITGYNFPLQSGSDSYSASTVLSPGDIYINKNGTHNGGTGSIYGLGVSNHTGDKTADPSDNVYAWSSVVAGHLYSDAQFATGTLETY